MSVIPDDSVSAQGGPSGAIKIASRVTVPDFAARKSSASKIVMVTAYDATQARFADAAGVDAILVGDSVGMTTLGHTDTLSVSMDAMVHHTQAVANGQRNRRLAKEPTKVDERRGARRALIISDLPFGSYGASVEAGVLNGVRLMQAGAQAVKLEGAGDIALETISRLVNIGVPVMGHLGLTPQSSNRFGGFRMQGKTEAEAALLLKQLHALTEAGVFALVLELIPATLAAELTRESTIPTIGIGAGPHCDGEVQVISDLLGLSPGPPRRHSRVYMNGADLIEAALRIYVQETRDGLFPTEENASASRSDL